MLPYFTEKFGNAASRSHGFGWAAEQAVDTARRQIAKLIGSSPKEIVFTSGATESNNLALKGVAEAWRDRGNHIITQLTEHKAVLDTCKRLEQQGCRVTYLPVGADGRTDPDAVRDAITADTILVSIQFANNEIGVIHPMAAIGQLCREHDVLFHSDAVQAVGKVPVDVNVLPIDLLSLSAHKIYGPKGVGALYVRRKSPRIKLAAQIDGGGHQGGLRSGTLDVPGIVGLGMACELAHTEMESEAPRMSAMRDRLKERLESALDETQVNGTMKDRLPGNLNISFFHADGEALMMALDDIAVSSGSACTSAAIEPSYVLRALGVDEETAHSSIRFGLGRFNTMEEVAYVADRVIETVQHLREFAPAEKADATR